MTVQEAIELLPDDAKITVCPGEGAITISRDFQFAMDAYGQYKVVGIRAYGGEGSLGPATQYDLMLSVKYVREVKEERHDEET